MISQSLSDMAIFASLYATLVPNLLARTEWLEDVMVGRDVIKVLNIWKR